MHVPLIIRGGASVVYKWEDSSQPGTERRTGSMEELDLTRNGREDAHGAPGTLPQTPHEGLVSHKYDRISAGQTQTDHIHTPLPLPSTTPPSINHPTIHQPAMPPRSRKKKNPSTNVTSTSLSSRPPTQDRGDKNEQENDSDEEQEEEETANLRPLTDEEALGKSFIYISRTSSNHSTNPFKLLPSRKSSVNCVKRNEQQLPILQGPRALGTKGQIWTANDRLPLQSVSQVFFYPYLWISLLLTHRFRCPTQINRPMSDSSCSNLNKHVAICSLKKQDVMQANLAALGITGTGNINPKEVSPYVWKNEVTPLINPVDLPRILP
ncbi:hypothetical protein KEM48_008979 [Puccinia striiformis f. sp. tritici PST-130]|nr:hypothetical protein KEM48_008979 [Puccinia striiformis f. sp. tritici PST-130]